MYTQTEKLQQKHSFPTLDVFIYNRVLRISQQPCVEFEIQIQCRVALIRNFQPWLSRLF